MKLEDVRKIMVVLDKPNRPQTALKRVLRIYHDMPKPPELVPVSFIHDPLLEHGAIFDAKERRVIKKALLQERQEWLQGLLREHKELRDVKTVWENNIAEWVMANAKRMDLVIKTASGSKRARSATDWSLLNGCPTNLLLVGHRRVRQPKRVLVALDMGQKDPVHKQLNRNVIEAAASLASLSNAEIHTASVVEVAPALVDLDVIDEGKAQRRMQKGAKAELDKLLKPYRIKKRHFPVGQIGQAMADCAKNVKADLMVVGTRAQPLKNKLGLGSSAQRILRKAPCDVLAVRP